MPKSYRKLSKEEWREIADAIVTTEKSMYKVVYLLGGKLPRVSCLDKAMRMYKKIGDFKAELDTEMGKQYGRKEMSNEEFYSYFYPEE